VDDLNGADCDAGTCFNPYSKCRLEPGAYFSDEAINRGVFKSTGCDVPRTFISLTRSHRLDASKALTATRVDNSHMFYG
jgi:hypothetical protein